MGGKLFKGKSVSMNRNEHDIIKEEIVKIISDSILENLYKIEEVKFMRDKMTFNDIDFIFDYDHIQLNNNPLINLLYLESDYFSEIYHNGPIISCLYKEKYHIDFMMVEYKNKNSIPFSNFISMQYYYDYEFGNFAGKIAKRFNCTLKPSGLYLTAKNILSDEKFENKNIFLTNDIYTISNFLGYNLKRYLEGFETENDFFEYLGTSPNFNSRFYVADELSKSTSRLRDKKRPKYERFLQYYDLVYEDSRTKNGETNFKLPYINCIQRCKEFNLINSVEEIYEQLNSFQLSLELNKLNALKFNGNIISKLTGLQNKELGEFIVSYKKNKFNSDEDKFKNFLQSNDFSTIENSILDYYALIQHT